MTSPFSEVSLPLPVPEFLPLGAPVSLDGVVACDVTLLDHNTDLSPLEIPLLPLSDGLLPVPVTATAQTSTPTECPSPQEPLSHIASPPRDLSREGPFNAYCAPSDTGDHPLISRRTGELPILHDVDARADIADVDPV